MSADDKNLDPDFTPATYKIRVDGTLQNLTNPEPTALDILRHIGKDPTTHALILTAPDGEKRTLAPDDNIDLARPGVEEFASASTVRKFVIYIDETRVEFTNPEPTGLDLLHAVGKTPDRHVVTQILPGVDDQFIEPGEKVDLRRAGVEKFTTVLKDDTPPPGGGSDRPPGPPVNPRPVDPPRPPGRRDVG